MTDFQSLQTRKMTNIAPAPVANGLSTITVPKGPTYYGFSLRYKVNNVDCTEAQAKADIKWVRVKINSNTVYEVTGKHLVDIMNKYYGLVFTNGQIYLPLARPWYKTPEAVENTAWGTRNVDTMTIEVEFGTPIVSPSLDVFAIFSVYQRDLGTIIQSRELVYTAGVSGTQEIATLPKSNGDIVALHLDSSLVTACDIEINNQLYVQGQDLPLFQNFTKWFALRQPQTGYVHFDAHLRNLLSDGIPIVGTADFRVKPTFSAAGTAQIVMETLAAPLGAARPSAN